MMEKLSLKNQQLDRFNETQLFMFLATPQQNQQAFQIEKYMWKKIG